MKDEQVKSYILQLYSIMLADDEIDPRELVTLVEIGKKKGLSEDDIRDIILSPASRNVFPETVEDNIHLLYDMIEIAWADGVIRDSERQTLEKVAVKMGFYEENVHKIIELLINEKQKGTSFEILITNLDK